MKNNYHQALYFNNYYHMFSRANGNEKLFFSEENYRYFLRKLHFHTSKVCQIYAYILMPNHFHLLVKIKDEKAIINAFTDYKKKEYDVHNDDLSDFIMQRFSNFLNGYTKAVNKRQNRKGALFMDYIKRSIANDTADIIKFMFYIHKNAIHHGVTQKLGQWKYDSYNTYLSNMSTKLMREEGIELFGSIASFVEFHQQEIVRKLEFIDINL